MNDGRYMGRVKTADMTEGNGGKPVLEITWELLDEGCVGVEVISKNYFTGGAKAITVDMMRTLGWDGSDKLTSMFGRECVLVAKTDPEYGQQWRPMTLSNKPMDRSKAKSFLAGLSSTAGSSPFAREPGDEDKPPF